MSDKRINIEQKDSSGNLVEILWEQETTKIFELWGSSFMTKGLVQMVLAEDFRFVEWSLGTGIIRISRSHR